MLRVVKKWASEYWISENNKSESLKDLTFVFIDSEGKRYYSWESMDKVPTNRINELIGLGMWAEAKISPESLQELSEEITKNNFEIIKGGKPDEQRRRHARITALCEEMVNRKTYAIPAQVTIAMAAMLCVREDENPNEISNRIQEQKISTFIKEKNNGNTFFLEFPIFKSLLKQLVGIDVDATKLLLKWEQDSQRQKERLAILSQQNESRTTTKTKEN